MCKYKKHASKHILTLLWECLTLDDEGTATCLSSGNNSKCHIPEVPNHHVKMVHTAVIITKI
jgi:hypothetical protein